MTAGLFVLVSVVSVAAFVAGWIAASALVLWWLGRARR